MPPVRPVVAVVLTLALVGAALVGSATGAGPVYATHNGSNVTHHEDPDTVEEAGSLSDVSSWLAGYLVERLGNSTVQLSQGQYETARSLLGDEFGERVEQLVDVAGETDTETDDRVARRLNRTQQRQERYLRLVSEFRATLSAYRAARAAGEEARARRLARELLAIAQRLRALGIELRESYAILGNLTGQDLTATRNRIEAVTRNVSTRVDTVRSAVFVQTQLALQTDQREISFLNPLTVRGRLTTANGSVIANRTVSLRIGDQILLVTTNASGGFQTTYRPTTLPLATTQVRARFVPRNQSVYLGTTASIPVSVTQVTPTLSVLEVTNVTRFGDELRVTGRVTAATIPAAGVPVVVTIGDTRLGTTTTGADGRFTVTTSLPATVPSGDRVVRARVALEDAALASVATTATTRIEESPSRVTVTASSETPTTVVVRGRLTGGEDTPVAGQLLSVTVADTSVTVTTGTDGRYATTVTVPRSVNGTVAVHAAYDGNGTNLAASQAQTNVTLATAPPDGPDGTRGTPIPTWAWGVLGVGAIVALLGLAAILRRRDTTTPADPEPTDSSTDDEPTPTPDPLAAARDRLTDDPGGGVRAAYHTLRERLAPEEPSLTHWELYTRLEADLDERDRDRLETVLETYEHVVYAPDTVDQATAETAVRAVADLLDTREA